MLLEPQGTTSECTQDYKYLGYSFSVSARLDHLSVAVELPGRAPRIGENKQWPDVVRARGEDRRVRRAVIFIGLPLSRKKSE